VSSGSCRALAGHYPRSHSRSRTATDLAVLGAEFYVMKRIGGVILRKDLPEGLLPVGGAAAAISILAHRHPGEPPRPRLRRESAWEISASRGLRGPAGQRVDQRYDASRTDDVPAVDRIAAWLVAHMPPEAASALIHNDSSSTTWCWIRPIPPVSWASSTGRLSTIGDPMMDLGTTLSYWMEPTDSDALQMIRWAPTTLPGCMTRRELAQRYSETTGSSIENVV